VATISRTSAGLLAGLALVCVVAAVTWLTTRTDGASAECPLAAERLEPTAQFVDREALLPEGTVGDERRAVVDGLSGLGPLGDVVAGRFYEEQVEAPALVPYGDRLGMVAAPAEGPASLTVVDLATEGVPPTDWAVQLSPDGDDPWTGFTGGAVGDDWVSVFSGRRPALLTLEPSGAVGTCLELPLDGGGADVVAVTDQAGADVVVLASAATAGWWLGVVDPADGSVEAEQRDRPGTWQEVKVADDLVVGSRWSTSTIGTSGAPRPDDAQSPWVTAWDLGGEPRWTYPASEARPFPAVLLDQGEDGTSYIVSFDRDGRWLDAVDASGSRRWRASLAPGEWSGSLWDDVVVVRGPDPDGGPMLRAYDVGEGRERWVVRARQAPRLGDDPRRDFGEPLTDDGAWWVPSPNGLLRIDQRTDEVRRVDSQVRVDELVQVGEQVLVRSGPAVLVTE
jgi:hypothetical protein